MVGHHDDDGMYGEGFHLDFSHQLESYQILLTAERSYQGLKDATSFGLISDKSAEKLEGENSNFGHFSIA